MPPSATPTAPRRPTTTGRPAKLPKVLTRAEVAALLAQPNVHCPTGLRDRALLELMYWGGFRVTETIELGLRDLDRAGCRVHLRPETTKGEVEAWATVPERAFDWLDRWIVVRRRYAARKPHLFTTLKGDPLDRRSVWKMVVRRAERAGIEKHVHPHMLRHSCATHLLQGDGEKRFDLLEVQRTMRHADVRTTMIYLHVAGDELHRRLRERGEL